MKTLLIVYDTKTGGSLQMALAAHQGARLESAVKTELIHASQAQPDLLMQADGYLFVMPENLGTMSGLMKDLFDRCYYPLLGQIEGRPYALMVCAGSDGHGAVKQAERILTGWRLKAIGSARIILTHAQTSQSILAPKRLEADKLAVCHEIGLTLASGLAASIF